jgi:hypothetical protein
MAYVRKRDGLFIHTMNLHRKFKSQAFSSCDIRLVPGENSEHQALKETRGHSPDV